MVQITGNFLTFLACRESSSTFENYINYLTINIFTNITAIRSLEAKRAYL